mmetsp:Transcript_15931/g.53702  ORF Transcript_15931/g.53702 Transcript_15931/m.53702 type:complete len:286 (-) Transcript_15931:2-859(-)
MLNRVAAPKRPRRGHRAGFDPALRRRRPARFAAAFEGLFPLHHPGLSPRRQRQPGHGRQRGVARHHVVHHGRLLREPGRGARHFVRHDWHHRRRRRHFPAQPHLVHGRRARGLWRHGRLQCPRQQHLQHRRRAGRALVSVPAHLRRALLHDRRLWRLRRDLVLGSRLGRLHPHARRDEAALVQLDAVRIYTGLDHRPRHRHRPPRLPRPRRALRPPARQEGVWLKHGERQPEQARHQARKVLATRAFRGPLRPSRGRTFSSRRYIPDARPGAAPWRAAHRYAAET